MALEQTFTLFFGTGLGAAAVLVFVRPRHVIAGAIRSTGSLREGQVARFADSANAEVEVESLSVELDSGAGTTGRTRELPVARSGPFSMEASFKAYAASPSEAKAVRSRLPPSLRPSHGVRWTRRFTGTGENSRPGARPGNVDADPRNAPFGQEP